MVDCLVLRDIVIWVIGNVEFYYFLGIFGVKYCFEDDVIG